MSRYTRGKWRAMLNCEGSYSVFTEKGRARRRVHAECFTGDYGIAPQEAKANARLIAHAPEMYRLLQNFAYPEEPYDTRQAELSNKVWELVKAHRRKGGNHSL